MGILYMESLYMTFFAKKISAKAYNRLKKSLYLQNKDVFRIHVSLTNGAGRNRPMEDITMKPKRKSYGEEAYELDNLYNEDIDSRYAMTDTSLWYN